jgi:hypothetical protein
MVLHNKSAYGLGPTSKRNTLSGKDSSRPARAPPKEANTASWRAHTGVSLPVNVGCIPFISFASTVTPEFSIGGRPYSAGGAGFGSLACHWVAPKAIHSFDAREYVSGSLGWYSITTAPLGLSFSAVTKASQSNTRGSCLFLSSSNCNSASACFCFASAVSLSITAIRSAYRVLTTYPTATVIDKIIADITWSAVNQLSNDQEKGFSIVVVVLIPGIKTWPIGNSNDHIA